MQQMTFATATGFETFRKTTRRPVGLERRLRTSFLQQWFNLSDPAVEDTLYDSTAMRAFVGIELGLESVPDGDHGLPVSPRAGNPWAGRTAL